MKLNPDEHDITAVILPAQLLNLDTVLIKKGDCLFGFFYIVGKVLESLQYELFKFKIFA